MYKLHIVQISTVYHFEKEPFWDDNSGFTCCAWCPLVFGKTHSTAPHITSLWKLVYHTIAKIKDIDYIYAHCVLLFCVVLLCCCAEHSDVHTHNHTHTCIQPYIHIAIRPHHPLQWQVSHGRFGVHRDRWRARLQGTQPTCPGVSENRGSPDMESWMGKHGETEHKPLELEVYFQTASGKWWFPR